MPPHFTPPFPSNSSGKNSLEIIVRFHPLPDRLFQNMNKSAPSDSDLLTQWLSQHQESAFRALVVRYAGLVHAVAKRTCGDETLAAEAAQLTFILLAHKAKSLASRNSLAGWLHLTAVMQAKNLIRSNRRETRKRERLHESMETTTHSTDSWQEMQPVLDDALAALSANDREAILLRFYRSLTIREIGETLGIATDAAQKRIDRATERLRGKLANRGCQAGGTLAATLIAGFAADASAAIPVVSMLATKAIAAGVATSGAGFITLFTSIAMKSTSFVPPLVALLIAGTWLGIQRHSIATLETQNSLLQKSLVADRADVAVSTKPVASARKAIKAGPIDWQEVASHLIALRNNGDPTFRAEMIAFTEKLSSLSAQELNSALDEIAGLGLPKADLDLLEGAIIEPLAQKDPALALTRFIDRVFDGTAIASRLPNILKEWAKKDPAQAAAWFDQQIATGKFDAKSLNNISQQRMMFEGHLIVVLLSSDPEAAGLRLAAFPDDDRVEIMTPYKLGTPVNEPDQLAYANLVRQYLPAAEQIRTIARWVGDAIVGYPDIASYMERIKATDAERAACIDAAFPFSVPGGFTGEYIDNFREWANAQLPGSGDQAAGKALVRALHDAKGGLSYTEAVNLAVQYHAASGNDDVLAPLLEDSQARENKEIARESAEKIADEPRRKTILEKLK